MDSVNKSGNFNRSFKTKTLKQSQSQISQSSNDPEVKINDIIRKDIEAEFNSNNDQINAVEPLSNSIIEISGDMLDSKVNDDGNSMKKTSNNNKKNQNLINSSENKIKLTNKNLKNTNTNNISNISINSQLSNSSLKRKRIKNDNTKESNNKNDKP